MELPDFDPQMARSLVIAGDEEAAEDYIEHFVHAGIRAMIAMADFLFDKGDLAGSFDWMRRAETSIAENDDVSPIYLASAYERGLGQGEPLDDLRKALALRERVGESGNVVMMELLMGIYRDGLNGAPEDHVRFAYWARKAAVLGSALAAQTLREEGLEP